MLGGYSLSRKSIIAQGTNSFMTQAPQSEKTELPRFESSIAERITGLDELRGIAILVVMVAHFFHVASIPSFQNFHLGGIGVDLFLIISGYLIAKILIGQKGKPNYFRKFYIRRGFRIFPLFGLVVLAIVVMGAVRGKYFSSLPFYLTFTQNFLFDPDQLAGNWVSEAYSPIPGLGPLWSLAIEEHFYLLMPLLIAIFPARHWPWCFAIIAGVGIALNCYHHKLYAPEAWNLYPNERFTYLRMEYLAFGVLMNFSTRWWIYLSLIGFWAISSFSLGSDIPVVRLSVLLLLLTIVDLAIRTKWKIRSAILARWGVLCFGIYVLHIPIFIVMQPLLEKFHVPSWIGFVAFLAVCYVAASISFKFFEMPVQRLRTRFEQ